MENNTKHHNGCTENCDKTHSTVAGHTNMHGSTEHGHSEHDEHVKGSHEGHEHKNGTCLHENNDDNHGYDNEDDD